MGCGNRRWQSFGAFRAHHRGNFQRPVDSDAPQRSNRPILVVGLVALRPGRRVLAVLIFTGAVFFRFGLCYATHFGSLWQDQKTTRKRTTPETRKRMPLKSWPPSSNLSRTR